MEFRTSINVLILKYWQITKFPLFIIWEKVQNSQQHFSSTLTQDHNMPLIFFFFFFFNGPGDQLDIKHAPWQSSSIAPEGAITFYCPISKGQNSCFNWCKWEEWDMHCGWLVLEYISLTAPSEWDTAAFCSCGRMQLKTPIYSTKPHQIQRLIKRSRFGFLFCVSDVTQCQF